MVRNTWAIIKNAIALSLVVTSQIAVSNDTIQLSTNCPPSFMKTAANECEFVSLYSMYGSVRNQGLGGTQSNLPEILDGFSPEVIDLGRYLFFDPVLSVDGKQSCASCHQPDKGFGDGMPRSIGHNGAITPRSAPTIWNIGFSQRFFWDARSDSLTDQATGPLFNTVEMANDPKDLLTRINEIDDYRRLFSIAFPTEGEKEISLDEITEALAAFQASLISMNSRYDAYAHGDHSALNEQETQGLNVFRSFVARCSECHTPPLFTNNQISVIGVAERDGEPLDIGAEETFGSDKLRGGFKNPTLRNVALTAPYMHAGQKENLEDVVRFYSRGRGNELGEKDGLLLHWHISQPDLTEEEIHAVVAFLGALTDESMKPVVPATLPSGMDTVH